MTRPDTIRDIISTYLRHIATVIIGCSLGNEVGYRMKKDVETKIWRLTDELWKEAQRKVMESGYSSADELFEKFNDIRINELARIATNTIDPHPLYNHYPFIGLVAGAVILPLSARLLSIYGPGLASKLRDTYHTWKGESQGEQIIDI